MHFKGPDYGVNITFLIFWGIWVLENSLMYNILRSKKGDLFFLTFMTVFVKWNIANFMKNTTFSWLFFYLCQKSLLSEKTCEKYMGLKEKSFLNKMVPHS